MFSIISTSIEVIGALSITIGVGILFGLGAALIVGGALAITGSILASKGAVE